MSYILHSTIIVGVLNCTPDSFSDGGVYFQPDDAERRATEMLHEGADIIDVGAVSTRPGSTHVSAEEEVRRLKSVSARILTVIPLQKVCFDVASDQAINFALGQGAGYLNLCGGLPVDVRLRQRISRAGISVIVYPGHRDCDQVDVLDGRLNFFAHQQALASEVGIVRSRLILDPGIGFGQKYQQCIEAVRGYSVFAALGCSLMIGVSRKQHLARLMRQDPQTTSFRDRLEAGLAAAAVAVLSGASLVRTHDVKETKRFFTVFDALRNHDVSLK